MYLCHLFKNKLSMSLFRNINKNRNVHDQCKIHRNYCNESDYNLLNI